MKGTTIDNLDLATHERYALDQHLLERKYLVEAPHIPQHASIEGTSTIYSSQWMDLFEIHMRNLPWAAFSTPPKYGLVRKRLFAYRIMAIDEEEGEFEDEEGSENDRGETFFQEKILKIKKATGSASLDFEKDKISILNLFEGVRMLNKWLKFIYARKMQFHKG